MSNNSQIKPLAAGQSAAVDWLSGILASRHEPVADPVRLTPLQTEASHRQFYRVHGAKQPLVLMNSPPALERNTAFVAIAAALSQAGICVPEVLAHNVEQGWLLLTDLGSQHFIDAYKQGQTHESLTAALVTLKHLAPLRDPAIEPYTPDRLRMELGIFEEWLVDRGCHVALPTRQFESATNLLLANAAAQPQVCVHRDFHCKNLLLVPATPNTSGDSSGSNAPTQVTGVLDFQDALIGPAGYDLASLLHDCYWQFDDALIAATINQAASTLDQPELTRRAIDLLAIQRQLKAVGIFARLALRDGKDSHLPHITPVVTNLSRLCARYPEFTSLGDWLQTALLPVAREFVATTQATGSDNKGAPAV